MKRILAATVLVFSFSAIFGQETMISEEMSFFTKQLKIENAQRAKLSKVIIRKYADLEVISELAASNADVYRQKRRSIHKGTEQSVQMMLNDDQQVLWKAYKVKTRKTNAQKIRSLKAQNASRQDLLDAQYGIDN